MRKMWLGWMVGLGLLLLVMMAQGHAEEVCWDTADDAGVAFDDTFLVSAFQSEGTTPPMYEIHVRWDGVSQGTPYYQLLGSGVATQDLLDPTHSHFRMGWTITHDSDFWFRGNKSCNLTAILQGDSQAKDYLGGAWKLDCSGATTPGFKMQGRMTFVDCNVQRARGQVRAQSRAFTLSNPSLIGE